MKNLIYSDEVVARSRRDMAAIYRKIRKDNPAMARLLFKRQTECTKQLIDRLMFGYSTGAGLSGLLNESGGIKSHGLYLND